MTDCKKILCEECLPLFSYYVNSQPPIFNVEGTIEPECPPGFTCPSIIPDIPDGHPDNDPECEVDCDLIDEDPDPELPQFIYNEEVTCDCEDIGLGGTGASYTLLAGLVSLEVPPGGDILFYRQQLALQAFEKAKQILQQQIAAGTKSCSSAPAEPCLLCSDPYVDDGTRPFIKDYSDSMFPLQTPCATPTAGQPVWNGFFMQWHSGLSGLGKNCGWYMGDPTKTIGGSVYGGTAVGIGVCQNSTGWIRYLFMLDLPDPYVGTECACPTLPFSRLMRYRWLSVLEAVDLSGLDLCGSYPVRIDPFTHDGACLSLLTDGPCSLTYSHNPTPATIEIIMEMPPP